VLVMDGCGRTMLAMCQINEFISHCLSSLLQQICKHIAHSVGESCSGAIHLVTLSTERREQAKPFCPIATLYIAVLKPL
jgi:hypothetical protein